MSDSKRRSHSKINQLPPNLVEAINQLFVSGVTYEKITEFIQNKGHEVSIGSVGRYGRNFLNEMKELNVFREQVKSVIDSKNDAPATDMAEAASMFAIQKLFNYLLDPELEVKEKTEVMKTIALLERSGVSREKLKMDYKKTLKSALADYEKFKQEVYDEIYPKDPTLYERLIQLASPVAERLEAELAK